MKAEKNTPTWGTNGLDKISLMARRLLIDGIDRAVTAVGRFHKKHDIVPRPNNKKQAVLRLHLIQEELGELALAMHDDNRVEQLDALADLLYVVSGMAHTLQLPLGRAFYRVHMSNMSKKVSEDPRVETRERTTCLPTSRNWVPQRGSISVGGVATPPVRHPIAIALATSRRRSK